MCLTLKELTEVNIVINCRKIVQKKKQSKNVSGLGSCSHCTNFDDVSVHNNIS